MNSDSAISRVPVDILRRLPALATLALVLLLGWRLAGWLWVLLPSNPPPVVADAVPAVPDAALSRHWFGLAPAVVAEPATSATTAPLVASGAISLKGLIAGGAKPLALLDVAGTPWQVQVGERFADRYTLVEVSRDGLVIDDGGQRRVLRLPVADLEALAASAAEQGSGAAPVAPSGSIVGQSNDPRAAYRSVLPANGAQGNRRP